MDVPGKSPSEVETRAVVKQLWCRLLVYRWQLVNLILFSFLAVVLNVSGPIFLGKATNIIFDGVIGKRLPLEVTRQQAAQHFRDQGQDTLARIIEKSNAIAGQGIDFSALGKVLLLTVLIYLLAAAMSFVAQLFGRTLVYRAGRQLRKDISQQVDRLPLSYFDDNSRGDILSCVTNDVDNLVESTRAVFSQIFTAVFMLIGLAVMMFSISWQLSLLALLVLPLGAFAATVLMRKAAPHFRAQWSATGEVSNAVEDTFSGHLVMLAYGRGKDMIANFEKHNQNLQKSALRAQFLSGLVQPIINVASNLSYVVVAVAGVFQVMAGSITLGSMQAFIQYSRQFNRPVSQISALASQIQSGLASARRSFDFLAQVINDNDTETEMVSIQDTPKKGGGIRFEQVKFGYIPGKPVIKNLNLEVSPGQTVAIVGPTGAGKTTLVNLLMRFYEVDEGIIYLDGKNIAEIKKSELRTHFSMVLQDTWLFKGTVAENIAYGRAGEVDLKEVQEAAQAIGIDHMIRSFPQGYDTEVDDSGEGLSAGQKQLLTIARAFIGDPEIMILDEATSSVDTRTEKVIQQAMMRLRKGRTAFVIAHRLSTIKNADKIVVMEAGDVVEIGSHHELMAVKGAYWKLYQAQFQTTASK